MGLACANRRLAGVVVPGGVWIVDCVQRLYAAACAHLGESCRKLLVGQSGGCSDPWSDSRWRSGVELGVAVIGGRHDRRGTFVCRSASIRRGETSVTNESA